MSLGLVEHLGLTGAHGHVVPAWVLSGASLDMDLVNGLYYLNGSVYGDLTSFLAASGSTYTRASPATWYDSSGNVTIYAANTARQSNLGMPQEESRTNLVTTYNDITASGWGQFVTGTGSVTRTAASGTAPDGTTTASLLSINRSAGTDQAQANFTFTGTADAYSGQVWLKANSAGDIGKSVDVNLYNGAGTHHVATVTLAAGWTLFKNENKTQAANAGNQFQVGYCGSGNGGTSQTGVVGVLVWGADVQQGLACTSIIPTAGATATRAAEVLQMGPSVVSLTASANVWMYMSGTYARATINKDAIPVSGTQGAGSINPFYIRYSDQKASNWNGSLDLPTANTATAGASLKVASTGNASGRSICLNGGTVATDTGIFGTPSDFYLGSDRGTNYWWNGPITRFAIGTSLLSGAALQSLTT